jgi:hypothetical protein
MSRLIKRVPLDFDFPLGETWPGYLRADERYDPLVGDGWQVWQDVSEGGPISPVFADREALVAWVVEHEKCAPRAAEKFIRDGWAPSFIGSLAGLLTGVQMAAGLAVAVEWLHVQAGDYSTIAPGVRIRHRETGIDGTVVHRFPPPSGEYYVVTWDRGLPSLLADEPDRDPAAPMDAGVRVDGFEVTPVTVGGTR